MMVHVNAAYVFASNGPWNQEALVQPPVLRLMAPTVCQNSSEILSQNRSASFLHPQMYLS